MATARKCLKLRAFAIIFRSAHKKPCCGETSPGGFAACEIRHSVKNSAPALRTRAVRTRMDTTMSHHPEHFDRVRSSEPTPARLRADQTILNDLIAVLTANKQGLRRWSVMRAMRTKAEKANRDVSPKFEDDVERAFRKLCEGDPVRAANAPAASAIFFRPKEKAGEVWAVYPEKAEAWLNGASKAA